MKRKIEICCLDLLLAIRDMAIWVSGELNIQSRDALLGSYKNSFKVCPYCGNDVPIYERDA